MKKKIFALLSIILAFSCILFACDPIHLSPVPTASARVFGNGGSAVLKDGYLYFANAYVDYSSLGIDDNKYENNSPQKIYGIYRTKLNAFGTVDVDDNKVPQNVELVSYNIGGFAYSGLYICGEYLYYASPYSRRDSSGSTVTGLVRFERVRLDGTGREILFETTSFSSSCDYDLIYLNGTVFVVIFDAGTSTLSVAKIRGGNVSRYTLATNVASYAVYKQQNVDYLGIEPDAYQYVYYTQNTNDNYCLQRKRLDNSKDAETVVNLSSTKVVVNCVKNERVYYTYGTQICSTGFKSSAQVTKVYNPNTPANQGTDSKDAFSIVSYIPLDDNAIDRGIVGVFYDGSAYSFNIYCGTNQVLNFGIVVDSSEPTIWATMENEIYYQTSNKLQKISFSLAYTNSKFVLTEVSESKTVASNFSTSKATAKKSQFDCDFDRIFVYQTVNDSQLSYLTMYMTSATPQTDDEGNVVGQYVGVLSSADKKS